MYFGYMRITSNEQKTPTSVRIPEVRFDMRLLEWDHPHVCGEYYSQVPLPAWVHRQSVVWFGVWSVRPSPTSHGTGT